MKWSQEEDDRLLFFLFYCISPTWSSVSKYVASRSKDACRKRWYDHWYPLISKNPYEICNEKPIERRILCIKEDISLNGKKKSVKYNVQKNGVSQEDFVKAKQKIKAQNLRCVQLLSRLNAKDLKIQDLKKEIYQKNIMLKSNIHDFLEFLDDDVSEELEHSFNQRNLKYHKSYEIENKLFWVKQLVKGSEHFDEARRMLKGPAKSTVYNWIQKDKNFNVPKNEELQDISKVKDIIMFWMHNNHMEEGECVSIGYNAIAFDLDLVIDQDGIKLGALDNCKLPKPAIEYRYNPQLYENLFNEMKDHKQLVGVAFVVLVLPLNHHKPFVCHILFNHNGCATTKFVNNIKLIRSAIIDCKLKFYGDGFDADPFYSEDQSNYFDDLSKYMNSPSSCCAHQFFKVNNANLFNDPSHILKRMRKGLIVHNNLVVIPNGPKLSVQQLRSICTNIPDSVFENNNLISMNDWHPTKIFNATNVLKLNDSMRLKPDEGKNILNIIVANEQIIINASEN